jgi:hypothetical protein
LSCLRITRYNDFQIFIGKFFTSNFGGLNMTTVANFINLLSLSLMLMHTKTE